MQIVNPNAKALAYQVALSTEEHITSALRLWNASEEHTITLLRPDLADESKDQLYIDHMHIAAKNWHWQNPQRALYYRQGSGEGFLEGNLLFDPTMQRAYGSMTFGAQVAQVALKPLAAKYQCKLSTNAGAKIQENGARWTLVWDANSDAWTKAQWQDKQFNWGYEVTKIPDNYILVDGPAYVFVDAQSQQCWAPWAPPADQQAPILYGSFCCGSPLPPTSDDAPYAFNMEFNDHGFAMTFQLNDGVDPIPQCSNSSTSADAQPLFPYKFAFQFDALAQTFNGAMIVGAPTISEGGSVYAVQGTTTSPISMVGAYALGKTPSAPRTALISLHNGRLIVEGQPVADTYWEGNRLNWTGLPANLIQQTGLPAEGYLDFSPDGSNVIGGSDFFHGARVSTADLRNQHAHLLVSHPKLAAALASDDAPLSENGLLGMNPYQLREIGSTGEKSYVDTVQGPTLNDFYGILQYHMSKDLRDQFFSTPPSLDAVVTAIATDNGGNQAFYQGLQVPYLVNALATIGGDPTTVHLNQVRARKFLTRNPVGSTIYTDQTSRLYSYHWTKIFPDMQRYLDDQAQTDHSADIDQVVQRWQTAIQNQSASVADPDDPNADLQAELKYVHDLGSTAKQSHLYWAFRFFLRVTDNSALAALKLLMDSGNTSEQASYMIKRNTAVLNILDPSGYYSNKYVRILQSFQIANVMADWADYGGNLNNFTIGAEEILKAYLDKYIYSADPSVAAQVKLILKDLGDKSLHEVISTYTAAFATAIVQSRGQGGWAQMITLFERELSPLSTGLQVLGKLFGMAMASMAIVSIVQGKVEWDELTPEEQASTIVGGIGMLAHGAAFLAKGITRSALFLRTIGEDASKAKALLSFFFKEDAVAQEKIVQIQNGFARWLARGNSASSVEVALNLGKGVAEEDLSTVSKIFGRSLDELVATRIAAVLAIVNIVIISIELSKATSEKEKIVDGFFLAASALDLIAAVAAWSVAFVAAETIGATVLVFVAELAGPLGMLALLVGILLLFVLQDDPPPSPIQLFVEGKAKEFGYYMAKTAIDYFEINKDKNGNLLNTGLALQNLDDTNQYLQIRDQNAFALAPLSYSWDTVFSLQTDEFGNATFFTTSAAKNPRTFLLAVDANQKLTTQPDPTSKPAQQWTAPIVGDPTLANDLPVTAPLTLSSLRFPALALQHNNGTPQLGTATQRWQLVRTYLKPDNLLYPDLIVFLDVASTQQDYSGYQSAPFLGQAGRPPLKWSISPALPSFLKLDPDSGIVGVIAGSTPMLLALSSYTVTVSSEVESGKWASTQGTLRIGVLDSRIPYGLSYPLFCLTPQDTYRQMVPLMENYGDQSSGSGIKWSVSPALPGFLTLVSGSGIVRQVAGVSPVVMAATSYTVTVTNQYGQAEGTLVVEGVADTKDCAHS